MLPRIPIVDVSYHFSLTIKFQFADARKPPVANNAENAAELPAQQATRLVPKLPGHFEVRLLHVVNKLAQQICARLDSKHVVERVPEFDICALILRDVLEFAFQMIKKVHVALEGGFQ